MIEFESITDHVIVDISLQKKCRSSVIGGISLEEYSIAIDSGNSLEIGQNIHKKLEEYCKIPVKYLFLTHAHADHRGGMDAFIENTLIMSEKCKENLPTSIRLSKYNFKTFDEKLILGENNLEIEFLKASGHSIGSSVAYIPKEKVLFGGDLFFVGSGNFGIPFMGFYQSKPRRTGNPDEYIAAFEIFLNMDIDIIVPGHGDLVYNPREYVTLQKQFFIDLKEFTIDAIKDGKSLEDFELPELELITLSYKMAEAEANRRRAIKFADHCFDLLKKNFYNHYSK